MKDLLVVLAMAQGQEAFRDAKWLEECESRAFDSREAIKK